jgi:hypothetical protein
MSAGHIHRVPKLFYETSKLRALLHRIMTTGATSELMKRWIKIDFNHDIAYAAGYNVQGTTRYVDRDFARALYEPAFAEQLLGKAINTGLSPDDTLDCILKHEAVEKVILDSDCPFEQYEEDEEVPGPGAHTLATFAEHELVRAKGSTPHHYERGLEAIFQHCSKKTLKSVPRDYACTSLLDDTDPNARRVLKDLRSMGIPDALKISKEMVGYVGSSEKERCVVCAHWQATPTSDLSICDLVDGLVRADRRCQRFSERERKWTRVPLKVVGGAFIVSVEINGAVTLDFILDSGAADVFLPTDVAGTLMRTNTLIQSDFIGKQTYVLADGSKSQSDTIMIRSLKVGNNLVYNIKGSIGPVMAEPLLGQSFLLHFKSWSIDNLKHELLLEPR